MSRLLRSLWAHWQSFWSVDIEAERDYWRQLALEQTVRPYTGTTERLEV
jgi:hypothetical protein